MCVYWLLIRYYLSTLSSFLSHTSPTSTEFAQHVRLHPLLAANSLQRCLRVSMVHFYYVQQLPLLVCVRASRFSCKLDSFTHMLPFLRCLIANKQASHALFCFKCSCRRSCATFNASRCCTTPTLALSSSSYEWLTQKSCAVKLLYERDDAPPMWLSALFFICSECLTTFLKPLSRHDHEATPLLSLFFFLFSCCALLCLSTSSKYAC